MRRSSTRPQVPGLGGTSVTIAVFRIDRRLSKKSYYLRPLFALRARMPHKLRLGTLTGVKRYGADVMRRSTQLTHKHLPNNDGVRVTASTRFTAGVASTVTRSWSFAADVGICLAVAEVPSCRSTMPSTRTDRRRMSIPIDRLALHLLLRILSNRLAALLRS